VVGRRLTSNQLSMVQNAGGLEECLPEFSTIRVISLYYAIVWQFFAVEKFIMPFPCPKCSEPKSLSITLSFELPPDNRSDEITLQIVECSQCGFAGIAVYEESRRGALDAESFHHTGYCVSAAGLRSLREMIEGCPDPRNSRCQCAVHRTLGRQDALGRWVGLDNVHCQQAFDLKL